jgi:hypothetical protein
VRLEYTTIIGGSDGESARIVYSGNLTIVDAVATLKNCRFIDGGATDGIAVDYSKATLEGNVFINPKGDAVDFDFCSGRLIGNKIDNAGNAGGDGFDLSGSNVRAEQNMIVNSKDKGFSIGERTHAIIKNNIILNCTTGIAVKDDSYADIENNGLGNLQIGIAAYVKKLTYDASRAIVKNVAMYDVATSFEQGPGARLDVSSSARYVVGRARPSSMKGIVNLALDKMIAPGDIKLFLHADDGRGRTWGVRRAEVIPK